MTEYLEVFYASSLMGTGLDLMARATVLLTVALGAWWTIGRRRPLLGSAIGHASLVGLLLLPALAHWGPTLAIPLLRAETVDRAPEVASVQPSAVGHWEPSPDRLRWPTPERVAGKGRGLVESAPAATASMAPLSIPTSPQSVPLTISVPLIIGSTYALIAVLMLARLVGSLVAVERLRRSSEPVVDPNWLEVLGRLERTLGLTRSVTLGRSTRVGVPVVVGWFRPMILLPTRSFAGDPIDHAEAILLHELAHVRRGDYAANLLLQVVKAVYWPHPMAWLLAKAVAESRERACDAYCVHRLGGPFAYRAALLAMAEGLARRPGPALGLAMARSSRLGRRVREIDRGRGEAHCLLRLPSRLAVIALTMTLTAILGPARLTPAHQAQPQPQALLPLNLVEPQQEPTKPAGVPKVGRTFRLRVVAADTGKPVPKADVRVWLRFRDDDFRTTGLDGVLDIVHSTGLDDRDLGIDVWGDGFAMQRHRWGLDPNVLIPAEVTIKLQPGESLGGIVQDEEGRPVDRAEVYLWSHNYKHQDRSELLYDLRAITGPDGRWHTGGAPKTTGNLLGFYITHPDYVSDREYRDGREIPSIEDLRLGKAVSTLKKGVSIEGRVLDQDDKAVADALVISTESPENLFNGLEKFSVKTNAEGRFRTGPVKPGEWHLVIRAKAHAPAAREIRVGAKVPIEEFRLEAPHAFRARVVDPDGKPIEGAFVNIDTWKGYRCLGAFLYSDADGWVRWDDAPEDRMIVNINRQGYLGEFQQAALAGSDLVFTLKPSLAISGFVRDAVTRKAIATAEVEYGAVDLETGKVTRWQPNPKLGWTWFSDGYLNVNFAVEAEEYQFRINADGYETFNSRKFRRGESVVRDYEVKLVPGQAEKAAGPRATAVFPDGRPLVAARIIRSKGAENLSLTNGRADPSGSQARTDEKGGFAIPQGEEPSLILLLGEDGFAYANTKALTASTRLQARAYGRVQGRLLVGDRPGANQTVELSGHLQDDSTKMITFFNTQTTTTDANGLFAFDNVIPMASLRVKRCEPSNQPGRFWSNGEPAHVEDGKTLVMTVGGKGRPVRGRVEPPQGYRAPVDFQDRGTVTIESNWCPTPLPLALFRGQTSLDGEGWSQWLQNWPKTPEGRAAMDRYVSVSVGLAFDGSFQVEDVPPGDYRLRTRVNDNRPGRQRGPFRAESRTFTIPQLASPRSNDPPLDLGKIPLRLRAKPKVGDPAPGFEVTTVDGKKLAIPGDYRGKYVVLDFGSTWDIQSRLQVARTNDVSGQFAKDDRFAMLSLLIAQDQPGSRAFLAEKGQPWPQAIIDPQADPVADRYGIEDDEIPTAILIGPEGRIAAIDTDPRQFTKILSKALSTKIQESNPDDPKNSTKPRD